MQKDRVEWLKSVHKKYTNKQEGVTDTELEIKSTFEDERDEIVNRFSNGDTQGLGRPTYHG